MMKATAIPKWNQYNDMHRDEFNTKIHRRPINIHR